MNMDRKRSASGGKALTPDLLMYGGPRWRLALRALDMVRPLPLWRNMDPPLIQCT